MTHGPRKITSDARPANSELIFYIKKRKTYLIFLKFACSKTVIHHVDKVCPNQVKGKNEYDRRRKQDICIYTIKPAVQRVQSGKNREHNAGERCINPQ